jgi:hypothetical protein
MEKFMKMEVSNEYLMGSWTVSNIIISSPLAISCRAKIYLVSTNGESGSADLSNFKVAPKKPAHKSIHIHKPRIVAWPKHHIM